MAHNRNRFGRPIQGSRNQILTITMTATDAVGIRHRMIQMMVEVVTLHHHVAGTRENHLGITITRREILSPLHKDTHLAALFPSLCRS
jgi:hypothetical protein